jgi:DNA-binding transcriptional regulator YhcF (GntR family)
MLGDGHLPDLIGELLEVDRRKAKGDQKFVERGKAIWIKAQAKEIGVRELAEMVGVNPSTVTRWMQESEFQREIRDTRSTIEIMKKQGIWPSNKVAETRAGDISDAVGKVSSTCDKKTKSGLITESKKEVRRRADDTGAPQSQRMGAREVDPEQRDSFAFSNIHPVGWVPMYKQCCARISVLVWIVLDRSVCYLATRTGR